MNATLYSIFSSLPFCICLGWWVILLLRRGTVSSPAHRYLSIFALACMLLYFCHAAFFNGEETPALRVLYFMCNLSVYPLFWLYIRALTEPELPKIGAWWVMVPGPVAGVVLTVVYLCGGDPGVLDIPFRVLFVLELILVGISVAHRLSAFDRRVKNFYVDTEHKSLQDMRSLFFLLILVLALSVLMSTLGRIVFMARLLLIVPSVLFSTLLFGIFHVGFLLEYTAAEMAAGGQEEETPAPSEADEREQQELLQRIRELMESKRLYLTPGLKISDVAEALDTNRTYISACINRQSGMSFSDYVNGFRVRHAQELMRRKDPELTLAQIGIQSGFSGDTSFFRNFKKVTGQTPSEWLAAQ